MNYLHSIILYLAAMLFVVPHAYGQGDPLESYRFDIGGGLGMSGYLGDANESNIFHKPGFAANIQGRYLFNERTSLRAQLTGMTLSGDSRDMDNFLPGGKNYSFSAFAASLTVRGEYNFFPFGIGETYRRLRRFSPFLALGLGATLSACDGSSALALAIPMSAGVKYKINRRLNLIADFTMTKTLGDHLDGPDLADLTTIKSSFIKNTDWHSTIQVSLTYEFGPRCVVCNRKD
ncbi:MAG: porin family protein [Pseudoflavonifractor sp.]|nr:porin family protein [Alloprevotella sp.]MCM1116463.1 porin family protein [Pseudoflavonifractor sp.]